MKKTLTMILIGIFSIQLLLSEESPVEYKAHFLLYSSSYQDFVMNDHGLSKEEALIRIIGSKLDAQVKLKKSIMSTDKKFNGQWVFFGPHKLEYQEIWEERYQTTGNIVGAFGNPDEPVYKALDSLKKAYNMINIAPYILTLYSDHTKQGENMMIRSYSNIWEAGYAGRFLGIVTPKGKNTCEPIRFPFPEKHPDSKKSWYYGTLGLGSANWIFPVFAHKDSALIHFETEEGKKDSVYFPLGDDDHNVLDPDYGWDLSVVMDRSGADLDFRTRPDTLTLQQGQSRHIEIYPGWNDENTGKVLYATGDFYNVQPIFTNDYHCRFYQSNGFRYPTEHLGGYAVDIPHLSDAFALEYILVRYIDGLVIPSLKVPDNLTVNDTFTVTLTGTPHLMTSWEPQVSVSGVEVELLSREGYEWTYRLLSHGNMSVRLKHHSLQVLPDDTQTRVIKPTSVAETLPTHFCLYPNPVQDILHLDFGESSALNINIYDYNGSLVFSSDSYSQNTINVSNFTTGTYFLKYNNQTIKFIKK